jgi:eukaryotic-like serine/threonine-protein kinase
LQDVAPDGRVLVDVESERTAMATSARNGKPIDISWHDWNIAKDISPDGQWVLFEDSSEAAGNQYSIAIRKIDGTPPVQLGKGSGGGLSPDGKWAVAIQTGSPGVLTLVPIGPGRSRTVPTPGLDRIFSGSAHFLADGKHIAIYASEPGHSMRCYLVDIDGGRPVPITPEGIAGGLVSPNGKYVIRADEAGINAIYPIGETHPHPVPNLEPGFTPIQWTEDNLSVYGFRPEEVPAKVYKVNVMTGQKTLLQELQPESDTGVVSIKPVVVTRDGSRLAYSYYQVFSVLYVVSGLR